jgi:3-hydroxymyristoyl/3-hydroxydecanoyl-(acyl carrier protein) dehydratase
MNQIVPTADAIPLAIRADHPAYAGHFPGQPILPGVVLLDAVLHALAVQQGRAGLYAQIRSVKFHSAVTPGERLTLHLTSPQHPEIRFEIRSAAADQVARKVASGALVLTT